MSAAWVGKFHSMFQGADYHFITSNYGSKIDDYMGVGLAVPNDKFAIMEVDVSRLVETASPRIPKRIPGRSIKDSQQLKHSKVGKRPLSRSANEVDEWTEAAARKNVMPLVRLRCRSTDKEVCVGTYHMPCVYWAPRVQVVHAALAAQVRALRRRCERRSSLFSLRLLWRCTGAADVAFFLLCSTHSAFQTGGH